VESGEVTRLAPAATWARRRRGHRPGGQLCRTAT